MSRNALIRKIQATARQIGLEAEDRHDLQLQLTGKASLKDMSLPELVLVADNLSARSGQTPGKRPMAKDARIRLIHVLWRKLGEAGALKDPTRRGLNAFVRRRFQAAWGTVPMDVDQLREPLQIDDVVQALKDWGRRADIDFDWEDHRK